MTVSLNLEKMIKDRVFKVPNCLKLFFNYLLVVIYLKFRVH